MNEFDRWVRITLKSRAYLRYGDDFIMFCPTRRQAYELRRLSEEFLAFELGLNINPKNDIVVPAKDGLHFLGHRINRESALVDPATTNRAKSKIDHRNISSYKALMFDLETRRNLDWQLLDKLGEIFDK